MLQDRVDDIIAEPRSCAATELGERFHTEQSDLVGKALVAGREALPDLGQTTDPANRLRLIRLGVALRTGLEVVQAEPDVEELAAAGPSVITC